MTCDRDGIYVELALPSPKPHIAIDLTEYDIDHVGQDDGTAPYFRFVLQLGLGYMIYLWVVGRRPDCGFFHSFWTKDCAVAHVDMEEHGPPALVKLPPLPLPALHGFVTIEGVQRAIERATLAADIDLDARRVEARWTLADDHALTWDGDAWRLDGRAVERVTFA